MTNVCALKESNLQPTLSNRRARAHNSGAHRNVEGEKRGRKSGEQPESGPSDRDGTATAVLRLTKAQRAALERLNEPGAFAVHARDGRVEIRRAVRPAGPAERWGSIRNDVLGRLIDHCLVAWVDSAVRITDAGRAALRAAR